MERAKRIIIPTDFTVRSLALVKQVVEQLDEEGELEITLLHGVYPSNSISDLLFYSKSKTVKALSSDEFKTACEVLKSKFQSRIVSIRADVLLSNVETHLESYLEVHKIEKIYTSDQKFSKACSRSFDVRPMFESSTIPVIHVSVREYEEERVLVTNQLSDLFLESGTQTRLLEI